jgi:hypothetical protein
MKASALVERDECLPDDDALAAAPLYVEEP